MYFFLSVSAAATPCADPLFSVITQSEEWPSLIPFISIPHAETVATKFKVSFFLLLFFLFVPSIHLTGGVYTSGPSNGGRLEPLGRGGTKFHCAGYDRTSKRICSIVNNDNSLI